MEKIKKLNLKGHLLTAISYLIPIVCGAGLGLLPVVIATGISYSIAGKPGIAPGFIIGLTANAIGAGCCMICETCSYPDSPCRFPQKKISSMEACGMLVSEVCQKNDLKYYYGPNTISYVAGVLFMDFSL